VSDLHRRDRCVGKIRFDTTADAQAALDSIKNAGRWHARMNTYTCRSCGFIHIGHHREERSHLRVTLLDALRGTR
jgi:rubrerythrin